MIRSTAPVGGGRRRGRRGRRERSDNARSASEEECPRRAAHLVVAGAHRPLGVGGDERDAVEALGAAVPSAAHGEVEGGHDVLGQHRMDRPSGRVMSWACTSTSTSGIESVAERCAPRGGGAVAELLDERGPGEAACLRTAMSAFMRSKLPRALTAPLMRLQTVSRVARVRWATTSRTVQACTATVSPFVGGERVEQVAQREPLRGDGGTDRLLVDLALRSSVHGCLLRLAVLRTRPYGTGTIESSTERSSTVVSMDVVSSDVSSRTDGQRPTRAERKRQAIAEAATEAFLDNGYTRTSMDDIARLAGCVEADDLHALRRQGASALRRS